ncbi:MAG: ATP-binding cassette domain-containing protein [Desulfobacteraceae bacterium]|nr:ATP-binding cassette domain-containing protein [Desulfobacteraceae bacterium]
MLKVQSLECRITKGALLFKEISFSLEPGCAIMVEAGSGRGKSSFLFCLKGIFQPDKQYFGTLLLDGMPLDDAGRQEIGLVLQNPHSQMISTLVREELKFGATRRPEQTRAIHDRTVEILGLSPLLDKPVRNLSSGQKHMVAIGAAGIMNHRVLLMDEPFLYLDQENIARVLAYIDYLKSLGTGLVVTSHPGVVAHDRFEQVLPLGSPKPFSPLPVPDNENARAHDRQRGAITLKGAGFAYGKHPIVSRLDLKIKPGEELWISGENGSGKTTLLKILSGEKEPDYGTVVHQGGREEFRISTITQNPDRSFFESSVLGEMTAVIRKKNREIPLTESEQREIQAVLDRVGLGTKQHLSPFRLSFGEKVFLGAAQAWMLNPDFIFVDDILGFLDTRERVLLLQFLRELRQRTDCGLVFTSSRGLYPPDGKTAILSMAECRGKGPPDSRHRRAEPRKQSLGKRIIRAFKTPAFDYVTTDSWLHRAKPLTKMGLSMLIWVLLYNGGVRFFPAMAGLLLAYYLSARLGIRRFLGDSRFFLIQALVFCVFMPLFRWDPRAVLEGAVAGVRVWLFFIPVIVMMRTTTMAQWMNLFNQILPKRARLSMGIAFGLLPCITADAKEILHLQKQRGLIPERKDLLHPRRLFYGLRAVFVPLLIVIEDISALAGLSVKLKGHDQ